MKKFYSFVIPWLVVAGVAAGVAALGYGVYEYTKSHEDTGDTEPPIVYSINPVETEEYGTVW